jgi:hypothetical protein
LPPHAYRHADGDGKEHSILVENNDTTGNTNGSISMKFSFEMIKKIAHWNLFWVFASIFLSKLLKPLSPLSLARRVGYDILRGEVE